MEKYKVTKIADKMTDIIVVRLDDIKRFSLLKSIEGYGWLAIVFGIMWHATGYITALFAAVASIGFVFASLFDYYNHIKRK